MVIVQNQAMQQLVKRLLPVHKRPRRVIMCTVLLMTGLANRDFLKSAVYMGCYCDGYQRRYSVVQKKYVHGKLRNKHRYLGGFWATVRVLVKSKKLRFVSYTKAIFPCDILILSSIKISVKNSSCSRISKEEQASFNAFLQRKVVQNINF